jgi:hypothetical protein
MGAAKILFSKGQPLFQGGGSKFEYELTFKPFRTIFPDHSREF